MPIKSRDDAVEVESRIARIFGAPAYERAAAVRALFVEVLDFDPASGHLDLDAAPANVALPPSAERIAYSGGVHVVYLALETPESDRVHKAEVAAAAKGITDQLGSDLLLVVTNSSVSQLHLVYPNFDGARPILRRMVVERDLSRRTAIQQVSNIYWKRRESKSIQLALYEAFDVEPVTREFFKEYKRVFEAAESSASGFGGDVEAKRRFVQTLFNRLMFVYFLSRKGWLTFNGDKDYLNALWSDYRSDSSQTNFYISRLVPLFFAGLNNPQSQDLMRDNAPMHGLIGDVPFLNGGLFEETDLDKHPGVAVSDEVIEPILSELFDRFNFTVMESTPFDVEVAVDPEMLGKVFEELVNERHESGAYYTPRPVVSFMCREALKGYLEGQDTGVTPEAIARFVDKRDTSGISSVASAHKVAEVLDEVTIVDPACGSGAYLLGMMQELVELQTALFNVGVDPKGLYDLKMHVIQRNLYGVDIDDFAVNIAMLRMWLSLAIEYEGATPPPLPNLDFKVLCGDSLLGPDPSAENYGDLFRHRAHSAAAQLASLKVGHLAATTGKDVLKEEIERVQDQLREALTETPAPVGAIDWRVEFAEVFVQRGGFDIAVANPPYGITIRDRRSRAISHPDSYTNFMALATEIMPSGVMAYITPTSWETGEGFKKFRQFLFGKIALRSLANLPYDVFDTPYVDTAITVGTVTTAPPKSFNLATFEKRRQLDLTQIIDYLEPIRWSVINSDAELRVPLLGWAANLFNRISAKATTLDKIASSKRGIESYKYEVLKQKPPNASPFFTGRLRRYEILPSPHQAFVVVNELDSPFHKGPRILTRRIVSRGNRLMSAATDEDFVVKKDLYSLKIENEQRRRLAVLLAILNSSLMSFLYLTRSSAATKDDFRQVTLAGIRELPVVFPAERETEVELVQLVKMRENHLEQARDLDRQIDKIVYYVYGVTDSEQSAIEDWLAQPG